MLQTTSMLPGILMLYVFCAVADQPGQLVSFPARVIT